MALVHLNIRGRLILGFSVLCVLLAAVVGTTIIKVRTVSETTERTVNLRVPTAMTAAIWWRKFMHRSRRYAVG